MSKSDLERPYIQIYFSEQADKDKILKRAKVEKRTVSSIGKQLFGTWLRETALQVEMHDIEHSEAVRRKAKDMGWDISTVGYLLFNAWLKGEIQIKVIQSKA